MQTYFITPNPSSMKSLEIINEDKKYICKFEIIDDLIETNLLLDNNIKFKGSIFIEKIQSQIKAFLDYNIYEIFEEINQLNSSSFSIIKEKNKYKLNIEFMILRKKRNMIINLEENKLNYDLVKNLINNYENIIKEKENIILELKDKIEELEDKLKDKAKEKTEELEDKFKDKIEDKTKEKIEESEGKIKEKDNEKKEEYLNKNLCNNFNINSKNTIHKINFHKESPLCLTVLNDGRLVSGSNANNITIYNKLTYQPDLIIKEHKKNIRCIIQLSSGELASCSDDKTIKLFNIKENNYKVLQTLTYHKDEVLKILELSNNNLVSCSDDESIIFYLKNKNNSKYEQEYKKSTKGSCSSITQTKENEICFLEYYDKYNICFFNLNERIIKSSIYNISSSDYLGPFIMITKDLLIIGGINKISIINVNEYKIVRIIEVLNSRIYGFCKLDENMFLTGDSNGKIRQWGIEGDNLNLISQKEKAHNKDIYALINLGDGHIASSSNDKSIKIW